MEHVFSGRTCSGWSTHIDLETNVGLLLYMSYRPVFLSPIGFRLQSILIEIRIMK